MVFGNGVKNIQAAAYNGARTVFKIRNSENWLFDDVSEIFDIKMQHRITWESQHLNAFLGPTETINNTSLPF